MSNEKLGITNLSVAVIAAVNFAERVEDKADDGKITLLEAFSVGTSSFTDVISIVRKGKVIKEEFLDLDDDEKTELIALIKVELDLENDKVEAVVEKAIDFVASVEDLISAIKDLKN